MSLCGIVTVEILFHLRDIGSLFKRHTMISVECNLYIWACLTTFPGLQFLLYLRTVHPYLKYISASALMS